MKQDLPPHIQQMRKLFLPKMKEVSDQCASCPFRISNDAEWQGILQKLKDSSNEPGKLTRRTAARARSQILDETRNRPDFSCHHSVYNPDMTMKPAADHRQCLGASKWFRGEEIG